jgi:hypothetical protein
MSKNVKSNNKNTKKSASKSKKSTRNIYKIESLEPRLMMDAEPLDSALEPNLDMEQNGMVAEDNGTSSGICIGMIFEGETDGIFVISQKSVSVDDAWYTLEGVKVSKPVKGIYIHQNKKVVVK